MFLHNLAFDKNCHYERRKIRKAQKSQPMSNCSALQKIDFVLVWMKRGGIRGESLMI